MTHRDRNSRRPVRRFDDEPGDQTPAAPEPDFVDRRSWLIADSTVWGDAPRRELEPMGEVLDVVLGRFAGSARSVLQQIDDAWGDVAGGGWERARPVRLDGDTLVVEVPDGLTASRLQFDTARFIGMLEGIAGGAVQRVRFRVARD